MISFFDITLTDARSRIVAADHLVVSNESYVFSRAWGFRLLRVTYCLLLRYFSVRQGILFQVRVVEAMGAGVASEKRGPEEHRSYRSTGDAERIEDRYMPYRT